MAKLHKNAQQYIHNHINNSLYKQYYEIQYIKAYIHIFVVVSVIYYVNSLFRSLSLPILVKQMFTKHIVHLINLDWWTFL